MEDELLDLVRRFASQLALTLSWKEGCLSPLELELEKATPDDDLGIPVP